jgi:hypothetical protein
MTKGMTEFLNLFMTNFLPGNIVMSVPQSGKVNAQRSELSAPFALRN